MDEHHGPAPLDAAKDDLMFRQRLPKELRAPRAGCAGGRILGGCKQSRYVDLFSKQSVRCRIRALGGGDMSIDVSGVARIRHADNGTVYTVDPDELEWDEFGSEERGIWCGGHSCGSRRAFRAGQPELDRLGIPSGRF